MRSTIAILKLFALAVAIGCSGTKEKEMNLKEITKLVEREEGFEDIGLQITDRKVENEKVIFVGQGMYQGDTVGLKFETLREFKAGALPGGGLDSKNGFTSESIKILSIGQPSHNLINALSKLYNVPSVKGFTDKTVIASAFSLSTEDADLTKNYGHYKFKLFIEEDSDDLYCEVYFNINFDNGTIELPEKDTEYRENLIKAFTN